MNNSRALTLIILLLFQFGAVSSFYFAQQSELNDDLSNTWLLDKYYERLTKSDSICCAMNYSDFEIRRIYFNGKDSILNIGSLIEGNREPFVVKNSNELYVAKSPFFRNPYTLSLVAKKGKAFLALHEIKESSSDTIFYVSLPKEYSTFDGFEHFINDKSFTGTYISEDQKLRLNFSQDGKIDGFEDFNQYVVHHFIHNLNPFDVVSFQRKRDGRIKKYKSFNWRKVGKDIWLYNLNDELEITDVTTLFAKLKKVD
jgi:hypothetical protein